MTIEITDLQSYPASRFWMRFISFVGLRNMIALMRQYPNGLTAQEIVDLVREMKLLSLKSQKTPSRTTIYHYRNTLLHLGVLSRHDRRLLINQSNPIVLELLNCLSEDIQLSTCEKQNFGQLVLNQADCKTFFADLFWPNFNDVYSLEDWLSTSIPVIWVESNLRENRIVEFRSWDNRKAIQLSKENHIQAILYGVRYWFRDELELIDEIYKESTGNVLFPTYPNNRVSEETVVKALINSLSFENEWARVSIRDLAISVCIKLRISVHYLFNIIRFLHKSFPGHITLIPTSRSFATITASSALRENLELRSFFQDNSGVYISHLRIHQGIKERIE